jgi:3-oxoadipate enol-lactonase
VIRSFVDVRDGYLYYEVYGRGPDVVLLNAGAADLRMWHTTVAWLAEDYRVTLLDYRDTGLSSAGTQPYSEIEDLAAVLAAVPVTSAVLVACSDGARRALAYAHRYPRAVQRVVVVGGSFGEFPDPTPEEATARQEILDLVKRREHALATTGVYADAAVDIDAWAPALNVHDRRVMVGLHVANAHYTALDDYLGAELDPPVKTRFNEITTPITVLAGERDFKATRLWAQRIADQAPNAVLHLLTAADHFPMLSQPRQFEHYLREALQSAT